MDVIKIFGGLPMTTITPVFCTYFKKIEHFKYSCETYDDYTAFCVRGGSFKFAIGSRPEETAAGGDVVICPPHQPFSREVITTCEICMIKFRVSDIDLPFDGKIKISNALRFDEDLGRLKGCFFCRDFSSEPLFLHYCMDIFYLLTDSIQNVSKLSWAKKHIEKNYREDLSVNEMADKAGYTVPHFINTFKKYYGITPKAYISKIRILKAKELLTVSEMYSRQIAHELGFVDDLYFIRFFKKHTGMTPKQFRELSSTEKNKATML